MNHEGQICTYRSKSNVPFPVQLMCGHSEAEVEAEYFLVGPKHVPLSS